MSVSDAKPTRIESAAGVSVQLDPDSGRYEIETRQPHWTFAGGLGQPATNVNVQTGKDPLGAYQELRMEWHSGIALSGGIRLYDNRPVALFSVTCFKATNALPSRFPRFTMFPEGLHGFSHKDTAFAPPTFSLEKNSTPWLLFDDRADAVVISPADHFLAASMVGDGLHEIACGLRDDVQNLPERFEFRTLMTFGHGLGVTWATWGKALTEWLGRVPPANDADVGLRYLGYWTDNGGVYYYNYSRAVGYAGSLEALVNHYRQSGVPIRYLQLDSWWYYKTLTDPNGVTGRPKNSSLPEGEWNRYGGLWKYEAHPAVLPGGLAAFQKQVGLPLITHNRWIDPASPYHKDYQISGFAAIDPRWWNDIIGYLASSGVVCYEQDWLNVIYDHSPTLGTTLAGGDAFTGNMARAAQAKGLTLQYCMAQPRFFLQGARYSNLTTIRVSDDRFRRERWDNFLYNSQFARALGIWPWADVFMSSETNNLLLATLSAGMVGIGDSLGREDQRNLLRAARPDGVLIKPDFSLVPMDNVYVQEARGHKSPMVAWACTDHGALRTAYVFAYNRQPTNAEASFVPADFGFKGSTYILDTRSGAAHREAATNAFSVPLEPLGTAYFEVAAVGRSGIAFFGDEGKFVSNGRKRIAQLQETARDLTVTVTFASGENSVRVFGYADRAPDALALHGSIDRVAFDSSTHRFSVDVAPASPIVKESPGGDSTQLATVQFTIRSAK